MLIDYHPKCRVPPITSLYFANDIMVFSKPNYKSVQGILSALSDFKMLTGLSINLSKSSIIIFALDPAVKNEMAISMGIKLESPGFKYLGVPLTSIMPSS